MKKNYLLVLTIILTFLGFICGIFAGVTVTLQNVKDDPKNENNIIVSSDTIIEKLQKRSFLVTNSITTLQKSSIKIENNSSWSNFFWGKEINAEGNVQVDLGVDLSNIQSEDIKIDHDKKTIIVSIPRAQIYNTTVMGDIDTTRDQGILTKLLKNDPQGDYNLAKEKLTQDSRRAVESNAEYFNTAEESASQTIKALLDQFGYDVTIEVIK